MVRDQSRDEEAWSLEELLLLTEFLDSQDSAEEEHQEWALWELLNPEDTSSLSDLVDSLASSRDADTP